MSTNGGGWIVFQRRMDGTVNFYRNWADYLKGFGDLKGEFWLGLDKIHRLTNTASSSTLRVDMKDFNGVKKFAQYSSFRVGGADTKYTLTVSGYSGDAGDSMTNPGHNHNGKKFSTYDNDNDSASGNCAILYKAAWWYNGCHYSNLNGRYLAGQHSTYADGINWRTWKGYYYSLKTTEMKLRS